MTPTRPLTHDLDAALATDARDLARLHERLAGEAETAGLLEVAYRIVDTPIGSLLVAATEQGLVRVAFADEGHDTVLARLATAISPRVLEAPARLDDVVRQLDEYFAGTRHAFEVPLDLRLAAGPYRREVLAHLPRIGYGHTASYAEVAAATGRPRAMRAVGSACGSNPLPVVVPCHRVVRSDGSLGGYLGGLDTKRALLDLELAAA